MKIKLRKLQLARRTVQVMVLSLILVVPATSRFNNYLMARELDEHIEKWEGSIQGAVLAGLDSFFRILPGGEKERAGNMVRNRAQVLIYTQQLRGGPWSMEIAGLSMTDPMAAAESVAASKSAARVLLISLIVPLLVTIILGRVFCSWVCPMNLFLEMADKFRGVLSFLELKPRDVAFSRKIKYTLLGTGLALAALLSLPVLGYIYPPAMINRELHELVFGMFDHAEAGVLGLWAGGLTWMSLLLVGVALFEVSVSRRWWCRYVCPGGALYSLLGYWRRVRVKLNLNKCTKCEDCIPACPQGLDPMNDSIGIECDNCGRCISYCDDKALDYVVRIKPEKQPPSFDEGENR